MISSSSGLSYAIAPTIKGWRWTVFRADGRAQEKGEAASRAIAAACVIRCISRAAAPAAEARALRAA
jgi:hypothetical protein